MRKVLKTMLAWSVAVVWFIETRRWIKGLLLPIAALPPAIIVALDQFPFMKAYTEPHPYLIALCVFWPVFLGPIGMSYEYLRARRPTRVEELLTFIRVIENVVGKKVERFRVFVNAKRDKKTTDPTSAFKNITQPQIQINELITGVYLYFEKTLEPAQKELRVALARMSGDLISTWECCYPSNLRPHVSIEVLKSPQCSLTIAAKTKSIVIISDLAQELEKPEEARRYTPSPNPEDDVGSLICYPVVLPEGGGVPFVLSLRAALPNLFEEDRRNSYDLVLKPFAQRIVLEYYLDEIKKKCR